MHLPQHILWFDFPGQSRLKSLPTANTGGSNRDGSLIVPQSQDEILLANTGMDTLELINRIRSSAINSSTVDAIAIKVEQLCCDYPHMDARKLIHSGREWLGKMTDLLGGRLSLAQHRNILSNAGMLALLVGCLENDLGDQTAAEATRRMAMDLGKDAGESGIVGWSHEMLAWFHLTTGNYRAVINAAGAGIQAAPSHSVAVQLYGQQAKAYARMGRPEEVRQALEKGSALLDNLPFPERPDNHFVVDPDKWDFYAMDTYRIVGQDNLAKRNALEVIRRGVKPDGQIVTPMRNAEAQLTLAVIAARQGETDEAATLGIEALQNGRQSRPSLLMVASELEHELDTYGQRAGSDFRELFEQIKHTPGQDES
ncbi:MAG TPA: hypothetical protein VJT49_08500 [Amycolatopsis sp.]|nr:hypothetical protein [Amycolatopsis sp.]HKS45140.1 hypothetical protein [Amycolatopsis sp.]